HRLGRGARRCQRPLDPGALERARRPGCFPRRGAIHRRRAPADQSTCTSRGRLAMFGVHAPSPIDRLDITAPAFKAEPYALCAHLRDERPIERIPVAHPTASEAYLVSRYQDALAVLRDERLVKDIHNARPAHKLNVPWMPGRLKPLSHTLLDADGDEHR